MEQQSFLVNVQCMTYNHSNFITQALNGFTMQKTNFPYICTIIDDFSSDGEQDFLYNYLNVFFDLSDTATTIEEETDDYRITIARHKTNKNCHFAVLLLKYNHINLGKLKKPYLSKYIKDSQYTAICEGDDYWIEPLKLQKQIDFLESHHDYTMVCNRTKLFSERKKIFIGENYCYNQSQNVNTRDIIYRGGLFISTCSIVHRTFIAVDKPEYWKKCSVGDYPLQIMAAMKGKVFYMNDIMSVYRVDNTNSWMGTNPSKTVTPQILNSIKSRVEMLEGFKNDYPQYRHLFENKIPHMIDTKIPFRTAPQEEIDSFLVYFSNYINKYTFRWKLDLWACLTKIPKIRTLYTKLFMRKYRLMKVVY